MYQVIKSAKDLPKEWDELCKKNVYMSKHFLEYMEKVNYCNQSYHLFYKNKKLYSCFMMFEKKFNLFIFTDKYDIKVNMKFIYLPLSVTKPSIVFGKDKSEVEEALNKMKGIKILINTDEEDTLKNFTQGKYLPICTLENKWDSFDEYMNSLRAGYRRRYNQALKKGAKIKFDILKDNSEFTDEMYDLYEQVFNHSTYSLEKLNKEFFENDISKVITLSVNDKVEAIVQIIEDRINDTLIFEFGGYNYELAHEYDLYHNMLIEIVKYGIRNKFKYINLGQTAYDAKLKFGAEIKQSYFLLSHSNKFLNFLIKKYIKFLEYKVEEYNFNVFRNGDEK
jgi:hypothetical protein